MNQATDACDTVYLLPSQIAILKHLVFVAWHFELSTSASHEEVVDYRGLVEAGYVSHDKARCRYTITPAGIDRAAAHCQ